MKHLNIKILLTVLMSMVCLCTFAHDFEVDGIYYGVTSPEEKTVAVTFGGNSFNRYSDIYTGNVIIPESVTYKGTTYSVTSIA